jgi:hypothetical protein
MMEAIIRRLNILSILGTGNEKGRCCVENGDLGIFNRLKADTGEGLRGSLVAIVRRKDLPPFLSFDFTNTVKLIFYTFNEFTY